MSHRTKHLPELQGLPAVIRELRYHEASRQLLAIAFIILVSLLGKPEFLWLFYAGAFLIFLGIIIRLWASGHVKKNKVLATDGPYAFVRHPLYVGNILLLAGFALASQLWWAFPLMLLFLWFYYPPAIDYEDTKLHRLFGSDWEQWRGTTKALIPTKPVTASASSGWSIKQSVMKNGEPVIVALLLYCLFRLFMYLQ